MLRTDRVAGGALLLVGAFVLWESLASARRLPLGTLRSPGPAYVPVLLALALVLFGGLVALLGARSPRLRDTDWREWRQAAAVFAVCAFAAYTLERLGYRLTVSAMLIVLLGVIERRGIVVTLACALGLAFGSYYLFDTLLRVPLPRGPFGF
jgi:uncharacterized membrane protein YhaH (DUF805 family)